MNNFFVRFLSLGAYRICVLWKTDQSLCKGMLWGKWNKPFMEIQPTFPSCKEKNSNADFPFQEGKRNIPVSKIPFEPSHTNPFLHTGEPIGRKSIKMVERHEMITSPDVILTQIFACQRTYFNIFNQCNTVRSWTDDASVASKSSLTLPLRRVCTYMQTCQPNAEVPPNVSCKKDW